MVPHNLLLASCVVFIFKEGFLFEQINAKIEYLKKALARELTTIAIETEEEKAIDRRTTALEENDKVLESRRNIRNKLIEDTMVNHPGVLEENKGRKR